MGLGILDTIQLAATLIFAVPVGVYGADAFLGGQRVLGGGLVVVAVLMVLLPQYLTTPTDLPAKVGESVVGRVVKTPDDEE